MAEHSTKYDWIRKKDGLWCVQKDNRWLILVPQTLRTLVIKECHDGHWSIAKTYKAATQHYYWSGMQDDIKAYVDTCPNCVQKVKERIQQGIPANLPIGGPWEVIAVDMVGPYPTSEDGNRFLLVGIDCFTKNVEMIGFLDSPSATTFNSPFLYLTVTSYEVISIIMRATNPSFPS